MSGPKWMREAEARVRAEALGIPVLRCPECNELAKHWVPDSLEGRGYFTCAPRRWSFELAFERAPKGLSANDRPPHWSVKARSTTMVRTLVAAQARGAGIPQMDRCRVDVEWIVTTKHRRDTDNLAPFLKAIYDGLGADKGISAHIVEDDDPAHMEKVGATIRYDKGARARFVVTITEPTR